MSRRNQKGLASIIIVGILMVILSLITVGFAVLMNRATRNAQNRQLSIAASYAVQTGINDSIAYLQQNYDEVVTNTNCNKWIGDKDNRGPLYDTSNISGDGNIGYDCVLINPTPTDLAFQQIPAYKSQVVKMTTSPSTADKLLVSWQSSDPNKVIYANSECKAQLLNETKWNDSSHNCGAMLRLTLYPIPSDGSLGNVQSQSKTFFLWPTDGSDTDLDYSTADGSIVPVKCAASSGDYNCNLNIHGWSVPNFAYFYARFTPIYSQADIKVKAYQGSSALNFINVQAIIDVTAKAGPSTKRLQARVDTSGLVSDPQGFIITINPGDNAMPENALRSANTICKRLQLTGTVKIDSAGGAGTFAPCKLVQ